jgi:hypothetical protein
VGKRLAIAIHVSYVANMETVIHQVGNLGDGERSAAEQLVGHPLHQNQQLVIHVVDLEPISTEPSLGAEGQQLPDWCNVYAGLSDAEVAALERAISQRLDLTRSTP